MCYDYPENILIQESSRHLLEEELGWSVKIAYNIEILGDNNSFYRKSYKDIPLVRYLKEALKRLNSWTTPALAEKAIKVFEQHLSTSSLMQIKEETYGYIHDGIPVKVKKPNG